MVTEDQRRELCAAHVTLNGKPATIGGVQLPFAGVGTLDMSASAEWAWDTAARIVADGGDFWSIERPRRGR